MAKSKLKAIGRLPFREESEDVMGKVTQDFLMRERKGVLLKSTCTRERKKGVKMTKRESEREREREREGRRERAGKIQNTLTTTNRSI